MAWYLSDEQFREVMTKLFAAVGKKFHSQERSCRGEWFERSSWTVDQSYEFEKWLTHYVAKKLRTPMPLAKKKAQMFVFNYGWKFKSN